MTSSKVTALILTGSAEEVSQILNASFKNLINITYLSTKETINKPRIKYEYKRLPSYVTSQELTSAQKKTVNLFLKENKQFKFKELVTSINRPEVQRPSNAALGNYLIKRNYCRYLIVMSDNSSYCSWKKKN